MKQLRLYSLIVGLLLIAACSSNPTAKVTNTPATPNLDTFLAALNQLRSQTQTCMNGATPETMPAVQPVTLNDQLNTSARLHSEDMAKNRYFEHTGLNGSTFDQRNKAAGYTGFSVGENIESGSTSELAALESWRTSTDGHCQNMMQANINEIGLGYGFNADDDFKHYWTLVTGRKNP